MAAVLAAVSAMAAMPAFARDAVRPGGGVPLAGGWTARFFVSPLARDTGLPDDAVIRRNSGLGVNAQLSRPVARDTRIVVDLDNVFDRDAAATQGLVPPSHGRGLRIQLRKSF